MDVPEQTVITGGKLNVVEAKFIEAKEMNWEDLFVGYAELYAITYSSSIPFITKLLDQFKYAEIIFGYEGVLDDNIATIMALQIEQLKQIVKNKSCRKIAERIDEKSLYLYVSREVHSHEKMYVLKAEDGRVRVITGSANMSTRAFCGIQRENITFMEDLGAYDHYKYVFDEFRDICADNINSKAILKMLDENADAILDELELLPVAETLKQKKTIIIEKTANDEEFEIAANIKNLEKDLKPLMPKPDKKGITVLTIENFQSIKKKFKMDRMQKEEDRRKMPQLHLDYELRKMIFNNEECNLNPSIESVKSDIQYFTEYMDGFNIFSGDINQNKKNYFLYVNWFLASPFMPYLRNVAFRQNHDIKQFPVFAILYGDSNGGKTEFVKMLTKMLCGRKLPGNKSADFVFTTIDALKQSCEGVPIIIDDLDKQQYQNHASKVIKYDEWGIKEHLINFPSIAITTNEIPAIKPEISKRAYICHIDACLDKDKSRLNYRKINECMEKMSNSFYCEYSLECLILSMKYVRR
jgi:hypothetical protein